MSRRNSYWVWLFFLVGFAMISANAMALDLSSPRATVHSFAGSVNQYNFKQAAQCVEGADPEKAIQLADWENDLKRIHCILILSNLRSTINNSSAVVTSTVTLKPGESHESNAVGKSHLKLIRHENEWKIIPDDPSKFELIGGNQDFVGYIAAFLAHPETFETVREAARAVSCRANLKQLSLALQMFAQDHDNVFALTPSSSLEKELQPYVRNNAILYCPDVKDTDKERPSYSFNINLANLPQVSIKDPTKTIVLYEGKDGKLNFRHNEKASVAFADGHVKLVDAKEAKSLLWKP